MLAISYATICYVVFLFTIVCSVGFIGNFGLPKTIDVGGAAGPTVGLVIDALLLGLFAVQHSVMARPAFKRAWTRVVPAAVERSTYVLAASLVLLLLMWQWRPLPHVIWATHGAAYVILLGGYALDWVIVLLSTFMLSHFELFGLTQAWSAWSRRVAPAPHLERAWLYRFVRHPIMSGFVLAFWATPVMTLGHLVFAIACTGYILVGVRLEERDLEAALGDDYRRYQREVPMLVPLPRRRAE